MWQRRVSAMRAYPTSRRRAPYLSRSTSSSSLGAAALDCGTSTATSAATSALAVGPRSQERIASCCGPRQPVQLWMTDSFELLTRTDVAVVRRDPRLLAIDGGLVVGLVVLRVLHGLDAACARH